MGDRVRNPEVQNEPGLPSLTSCVYPVCLRYTPSAMVPAVTKEIIAAARRLLDKTSYSSLKISGDPAEYSRFYKDVSDCAAFVAELVIELGYRDQLAAECGERAEHWEQEAHTLGHIEWTQREQIAALRKSLLEVIEHCEELNLIVAEMVVRFGDPHILDEDCKKLTDFTLRDVCLKYEQSLRRVREKWDLPKVVQ